MPELLLLSLDRINTPLGEMLIVADCEGNLRAVDWADYETRMRRLLRIHYGEGGFVLEQTPSVHDVKSALEVLRWGTHGH